MGGSWRVPEGIQCSPPFKKHCGWQYGSGAVPRKVQQRVSYPIHSIYIRSFETSEWIFGKGDEETICLSDIKRLGTCRQRTLFSFSESSAEAWG